MMQKFSMFLTHWLQPKGSLFHSVSLCFSLFLSVFVSVILFDERRDY